MDDLEDLVSALDDGCGSGDLEDLAEALDDGRDDLENLVSALVDVVDGAGLQLHEFLLKDNVCMNKGLHQSFKSWYYVLYNKII